MTRAEMDPAILRHLRDSFGELPGMAVMQRNAELMPDVKDLTQKWIRIQKQLTQLLNAKGTFNAALKDTPELKFYLPTSILERVSRVPAAKKDRLAKDEPVVELDMDLLAATGAAMLLTQRGDQE